MEEKLKARHVCTLIVASPILAWAMAIEVWKCLRRESS